MPAKFTPKNKNTGGGGGQSFPPTFIPDGEVFTVPEDQQALFIQTIKIDGTLKFGGSVIEVK